MAIKPLNSVAGFSVGETPNVVIYGNGDITTNNLTTTGVANLNSISNVKVSGGSNGQVIQTDGLGNLSFVTIDTWQIQNGNSNVQVLANSNVTISVTGNANIATFTSTGANISGYLTVDGNIIANGNVSANNYLVTPATKDLIIAPATSLIRSYANINPYNDLAYDLGNGLARWGNIYANNSNLTGNLTVTDTANVGNLRTNNLLYANGVPWDLQEAAGSNTQVQYNDGSNNFGASANFTFDYATQVLGVNGNISISNSSPTNGLLTDNLYYSNGQPWDLQEAAGSNTQIQFNDGNNDFGASANLTFDFATQQFTVNGTASVSGNANIGNIGTGIITATGNIDGANLNTTNSLSVGGNANIGNIGTGIITATGNIDGANLNTAGNITGNTITGNLSVDAGNLSVINNVTSNLIPNVTNTYDLGNSSTIWGNVYAANFYGNISGSITAPGANTEILFNDSNVTNAVANFTYDKTYNSGGGRLNVGNTVGGEIITDNLYASYANINGNIDTSGNVSATGNISGNNITASGNISTTGVGGDITMTGGNITGVNNISANSANFTANIIANNLTVNLDISGNTANFTGNISSLNANLGNLATANYINVANDINVLGNIYAANFVGDLANGNSNVKVYGNANVEISVAGSPNVATISSTGLYVVGEINTTAGNMLSNGNITANGFLNSANANVTGQGTFGSVVTANITAPVGNISISAVGVDQDIFLNPTGNGAVDVGLHKIIQVGDPTNPHDAATKEYVDNVAQGVFVHAPVVVTSVTNLNATYANGGGVLITTSISGGKTIQFSTNHGLSVGDEIYWNNSFNGIIANDAYFVYSTPAVNQITVKAGFYGAEVTTLTNGAGLSQSSRANPGVGATLINAGANAALQIDGITLSATSRVLVQGQTNAYENGVYTVTTVGAPDSPGPGSQWVLTRATDADQYDPKSTTGLAVGDYFFVQQGTGYAGSSYMLSSPTGEIVFGITNIGFVQFSAAGSYSAGPGIDITGTTISANVDNVTTAIVGGNIVVKTGANLTTPNLGDATFSSLSWNTLSNGNVTANNLSISNVANITVDLTVGGNIQANGTISSNANVSGLNFTTNGNVQAAGNVLANNITANTNLSTGNANVSGNTITNALTVNNALSGNTANFSGNVILPNLTVNLELAGNTANFSGNVIVPNLTVNTELSGNTANFSGNVILPNVTVNLALSGNTANFTGNITAANANLGNLVTANYFTGTLINGNSSVAIPVSDGNIELTSNGNLTLTVTDVGANIVGNLDVTGNFSVGTLEATNVKANTTVFVGNTAITWANVTTVAVTANQTISSYTLTGTDITGINWLVKAVDSTGSKYSVASVQAVTDGSTVDYTVYGTVQLGGYTGSLAVNIVGSTIRLQVTPASSNSTVWTTQYRLI